MRSKKKRLLLLRRSLVFILGDCEERGHRLECRRRPLCGDEVEVLWYWALSMCQHRLCMVLSMFHGLGVSLFLWYCRCPRRRRAQTYGPWSLFTSAVLILCSSIVPSRQGASQRGHPLDGHGGARLEHHRGGRDPVLFFSLSEAMVLLNFDQDDSRNHSLGIRKSRNIRE